MVQAGEVHAEHNFFQGLNSPAAHHGQALLVKDTFIYSQ